MDYSGGGISALGSPLGVPNGGWPTAWTTPDTVSPAAAELERQRQAQEAINQQQIQQMAAGGNDYWQTALQSQAAGQQFAVPGFQGAAFGAGGTPPAAPPAAAGDPAFGGDMQTKPLQLPPDTTGGSAMGMSNPYLADQAAAITNRVTDNMQRKILPSIGYGMQAANGYGNSRQGVIEANAMKDMNQGLGDSLAGLYGNAYVADQNYDLGSQGLRNNFYTSQRGQDLQSLGLGADLFSRGMSGEWLAPNQAAGVYSPFSGLGTTTSGGQSGGNWQSALGGALAGGQFARNAGWW
jgi:hypothetical protein